MCESAMHLFVQEAVMASHVMRWYRHVPLNEAEEFSMKLRLKTGSFDPSPLRSLDREMVRLHGHSSVHSFETHAVLSALTLR